MKSEIQASAGSEDPEAAITLARAELAAFRTEFLCAVRDSASSEDCRRQARRCEGLAGGAGTEIAREFYLRMALLWRLAAGQIERREAIEPRPPRLWRQAS